MGPDDKVDCREEIQSKEIFKNLGKASTLNIILKIIVHVLLNTRMW